MTATTIRKPARRSQLQLPYGSRPGLLVPRCRQTGSAGRSSERLPGSLAGHRMGRVAPVRQPDAAGGPVEATSGTGFRRLRIRRILEVTGSCIMLTGFLVLALFG